MQPEQSRGRKDEQRIDERVERLPFVHEQIEHDHGERPADLRPRAARRRLRVGHHVEREEVERRRRESADDQHFRFDVPTQDVGAKQHL